MLYLIEAAAEIGNGVIVIFIIKNTDNAVAIATVANHFINKMLCRSPTTNDDDALEIEAVSAIEL